MISKKVFKKYIGVGRETSQLGEYTREVEREVLNQVVERFEQLYSQKEMSKTLLPIIDMIKSEIEEPVEGELDDVASYIKNLMDFIIKDNLF